MTYFANRRCVASPDMPASWIGGAPRLMADFRDVPAYVLLGDAGIGKTTAMKMEANKTQGYFVSARDFVCLPLEPALQDGTLFIDGLDEVRAGQADKRIALDQVRARLAELGKPRFGISCRTSSWYDSNDRQHLKRVSPDDTLCVISLAPLIDHEITQILRDNHQVADPDVFLRLFGSRGLANLAANPLNLKLLQIAIAGGSVSKTRRELLHLVCCKLLEEHGLSNPHMPEDEQLLDAAEYLSALLILTGSTGYATLHHKRTGFSPLDRRLTLVSMAVLRQVLASRLFSTPAAGFALPPYRNIDEFLAARYVANHLQKGPPRKRLLLMITGFDGKVMAEFHGFVAWLSELDPFSRVELLNLKPTVVATQADIRGFEYSEKHCLLEAAASPSRLKIVHSSGNLGGLATQDMASEITHRLKLLNPTEGQHAEAMVLAKVLLSGDAIPHAGDLPLTVVRNSSWSNEVRYLVLEAAIFQLDSVADRASSGKLTDLAGEIRQGHVADTSRDLLRLLLKQLYPATLQPSAVARFLCAPIPIGGSSQYHDFWASYVLSRSNEAQLGEMLEALALRRTDMQSEGNPAVCLAPRQGVDGSQSRHRPIDAYLAVIPLVTGRRRRMRRSCLCQRVASRQCQSVQYWRNRHAKVLQRTALQLSKA